jgi:RNA polymerase subunit RPABC4/transcription elongation factor Spt4
MPDLVDDLKDKMGQLVSSVDKGGQVRAAIDGIRKQIAEADRKRQVKRLEEDLTRLKLQSEQAMTSLGVQALGLYEAKKLTQSELAAVCQHIVEMKAAVAKLEQELAQFQPPVSGAQSGAPCPTCGKAVPAGAAFCPSCGAKTQSAPAEAKFCLHCGSALRGGAKFCPACGQTVVGTS